MNLQEQTYRIKQIIGLNESIFDWFKPKKDINYDSDEFKQSEEERFTCADCGEKDYNMYMVNDEIWEKYGNEKLTLCKNCLEKRMGRELTKDDISQHKDALVNKHNPEFKKFYNLQEQTSRIREIMSIISEDTLPDNARDLVKTLPQELKQILFKQWGAKQNPKHHPEGNSLKHILVVIRRAYHHYPNDPNMVMAALFHDIGKMDTYDVHPKTGQPTAYGHEDKSMEYIEKFKDWINSIDGTDIEEIKYLVKNHMKVKPSTWDSMRDKKKEPIMTNKSFDKLMGFTNKLDGGGTHLDK